MKEKKLFILCPGCKKKVDYSLSEYKPFCSYRCKIKDLAKWSDGSFSLIGEQTSLPVFEDDE